MSDDDVLRFARGELSAADAEAVEVHMGACAYCRSVIGEAAKFLFEQRDDEAAAAPAESAVDLSPGTRVSRYVVAEAIGAGAAGRVFRAFDPHLGRSVALKLVRAEVHGGAAEGQARVLREAQAMAKLSHPNVVNVFDAGLFEGAVFIVMELVDGTTLSHWLRASPRAPREVLALFLEAGRGLAAAHGAGLVHRDFKPDNVLVGKDGRARVTDFGLARVEEAPAAAGSRAAAGADASGIAGTPAYMAPEQFAGAPSDARTDQFSFCVALYMALYGQRPFGPVGGDRAADYVAAVVAGRLRPPPPGTGVPAALHRALVRGLAARPERRYPSMEALLADFSVRLDAPAPRPAAPRWAMAVGALVLAAAVAAAVLRRGGSGEAPAVRARAAASPCGDSELWPAVEECDDGNRIDGDGCSAACLRCGADGRSFGGGNGHCYSRHDEPLAWKAADRACEALGGHLVTYATERERANVFAELLGGRTGRYWIKMGRIDLAAGDHGWLPPDAVEPAAAPWRDRAPPPGGLCGASDPRSQDGSARGGWALEPCAVPLGYLCERSPWVVFERNGHAYRSFPRRLAWDAARRLCEGLGGHLLAINDEEENRFIRSEFSGRFWLGARRTDPGGAFAWSSGEPFGFTAFRDDEPDRTEVPSCLMMDTDRLWHDRSCEGTEKPPDGAVCEIAR